MSAEAPQAGGAHGRGEPDRRPARQRRPDGPARRRGRGVGGAAARRRGLRRPPPAAHRPAAVDCRRTSPWCWWRWTAPTTHRPARRPRRRALLPSGLLVLERASLPGAQLDDDTFGGRGEAKLTVYCARPEAEGVGAASCARAGLSGAIALTGVDGVVLGERRRGRVLSRNRGGPGVRDGRRAARAGGRGAAAGAGGRRAPRRDPRAGEHRAPRRGGGGPPADRAPRGRRRAWGCGSA